MSHLNLTTTMANAKISKVIKARANGDKMTDKNEKPYYLIVGEESLIDTPEGVKLSTPTSLLYNLELGDKIAAMIEEGKAVLMEAA